MSEWKLKRFWTDATVEAAAEGGFAILLDGRSVRTPAKSTLVVPTEALGQQIAAEWAAQREEIDPLSMPFTRSANAAIDKVRVQHAEVADMLAAYGDTDLLCYRADGPEGLIARQAKIWDPFLDWADTALDARLVPVTGIMHASQDAGALARLSAATHALDDFQLAAFHDLVSMSGSLILGFAVARGHVDHRTAWEASRLDEIWQIEQWGPDEEAAELAEAKLAQFEHAAAFFRLCG